MSNGNTNNNTNTINTARANSGNNYKKQLVDNYVKEKSKKDKHVFLDNIFSSTDISDIQSDLESFMSQKNVSGILDPGDPTNTISNKYPGVTLDNVLFNSLKKEILPDYIVLKNKRSSLLSIIEGEYIIDDNSKKTLEKEISSFPETKVSGAISSEKNRITILKKILGKVNRKDAFKSIIPDNEIEKHFNELSFEDQNKYITLSNDVNNGILTDAGLKLLIDSKIINFEQKKDIISNLIGTISLKQIRQIGLLNDTEIDKEKSKVVKKYSSDLLDDKELDYVKSLINDEDVILDINDFFSSEDNVLKISEGIGFLKTEKEFKEYTKEVDEFKNKQGVQTFNDFKKELKKMKVKGIENFKEGCVLKFNISSKGATSEKYLKFIKEDDDNNKLLLSFVGNKNGDEKIKIDDGGKSDKGSNKYYEIIDGLNNESSNKTTLEIVTEEFFDDISTDKDKTEIVSNDLSIIDLKADNDSKKLERVSRQMKNDYEKKKEEIGNEILKLEKEKDELKNNKSLTEVERSSKKVNINTKITQLKEHKENYENNISYLGNITDFDNISDDHFEELVQENNYNELLNRIDSIDPKGSKFGIKKGVVFDTKKGTYEIVSIDKENGTLNLKSIFGEEVGISFNDFFTEFKSQKSNRVEKINTFDEILDSKSGDWTEFGVKMNLEVKNGSLWQIDVDFNGKIDDKEIDFLEDDKGDVFKIVSIGADEVEIVFAKFEPGEKDKDTKSHKDDIELENVTHRLSFNELNKIINDTNFKPNWQIGKNYTTDLVNDNKNENIKGKLGTRFMNRLSIMEVYMAGKMTLDGIEDYFKRGNEVKSAELAMRLTGMFPGEFAEDFMAQTEQKQEEAMEKELTALGKISSNAAFSRVEGWLLNKDTPGYKKEAGLLLAAKYGMLYPKSLAKFEGTFLWYEVLGGKIGDTKFEEAKEKARKNNSPFSEADLLIDLLGSQCLGFSKPKRRSKYYKQYKGKIAGGFGDENNTGYEDSKDKRDTDAINEGGMAEVETNVIPNVLGWAKRAVEKGGSLKQTNELYFTMIHSGGLYGVGPKILEELKDHFARDGNAMILAAMGSSLSGQRLLNKTIRDISIDIHNVESGKYPNLKTEAIKLYNDSENLNLNFKERVENSKKFWDKYGNVLSRTLYMADTRENENKEYLKTDKIIAIGADGKYKDYVKSAKIYTKLSGSFAKGYMEDDVGQSGITGLDTNEIIENYYKMDQSMSFRQEFKKVIDYTWPTIWGDMKSIKSRIDSHEGDKNYNEMNNVYRKYLNTKIREILAGLLKGAGGNRLDTLDNIDPVGLDLGSIGIVPSEFKDFRVSDILDKSLGNSIIDEKITNAVEKMILGNFSEANPLGDSELFKVVEETKESAKNIT